MTIKYHYTRPTAAGRATIAYVDEKHDNGSVTLAAGVAYCGPKDTFCKHYGRDKARGRLIQVATAKDGWRFAERYPSKYVLLHIDKESCTPTTLQDFVKMVEGVATSFRPADVVKHYGP